MFENHRPHVDQLRGLLLRCNWMGSTLRLQISELGRASRISNQSLTPDDGGTNAVQRSEPKGKIIYSDSLIADQQTSNEILTEESSSGKPLLVLLIIVLGFAVFAAGVIYWIQSRQYPVVVAISPPDIRDKDSTGKQGVLIPLSPDLIHVTSIALGNPRLTIVNGKRLAEEDWLVVKTVNGEASVRVISIQDGFVRFKHGGNTIEARLQAAQPNQQP